MKKFLRFLPLLFIGLILLFSFSKLVYGEELDDINKQLSELTTAYNQSKTATAPHEAELNRIKARVAFIESDLIRKKRDIDNGYKNLEKQKELLDEKIINYYINSYRNCPFCFLLGSSIEEFINNLAYQQALIEKDKEELIKFALTISDLEQKKNNLESEQTKLADVKTKLDKLVTEAKAYQATLSSKIATLTAQQQQILSQRLSDLGIPRSAGSSSLYCTDDRKIDPGFGSGFAFFTFGIPHYVGMNQYGAYGRAKASQDYKTILNAYFQNISIECRDLPAEIDVEGFGRKSFEEYIKGVVNKEMGADLPEALKAQAIAARSYALVQTNNGSTSICATQSCQVYSDARRDAANSAVDATGINACGAGKGEVVVSNGSIAKTWYASTFGGYAHRSSSSLPNAGNTSYTKEFADTRAPVSSFADLHAQAYDNESACFYTAQGWREQYKNSAWLKPDEVADIANVILLVKADSSTKCSVYQIDKAPPAPNASKGCASTDNWSFDRVKSELRSRNITPYNSVSNVTVSADFGSGVTTNVSVSGDTRSDSFAGSEFKDWFNIRAPKNLQIVGPLFNIEKR